MVKDVFQLFDGQLRGSSSTEIDGFYFLVFQVVLPYFQFLAERMDVGRLLLALCSREEVAVNTSAFAEGDVDVDSSHGY